ncbi:hypothetical protein Acr_27g0002870 [Actinidia rufa]|uniref:Uncharacterized protein n=1 Tax=Actinidia rufa TaxID=165716 RepID=A0A7J0H6A2_9ERIC|nr:hypothetical protein Acr_27g0002870 [Actinidia rufa]
MFPLLVTSTPLRSVTPPNPPNSTLNLATPIPPLNSIFLNSPSKTPPNGFTELNNTLNSKVLSLLNEFSLLRSTSKELSSNGTAGSPNSRVPSIGPRSPRHYFVVLDPPNMRIRPKLLPVSSTPPPRVFYQEEFEKLSQLIDALPNNHLIGIFIAGLKDEVRLDVKLKNSRTPSKAIRVA